jgi:hypothetical protein
MKNILNGNFAENIYKQMLLLQRNLPGSLQAETLLVYLVSNIFSNSVYQKPKKNLRIIVHVHITSLNYIQMRAKHLGTLIVCASS